MCDIILPAASIQTKQGHVSGFHLLLFSPSSLLFSPLPPFFLLFLEKVGGGREMAELQEFRSLSHLSLELSTTAPLV